MNKNDHVVIMVTASSEDEAKLIGERLLKEKLAACANFIAGMHSLFVWKEKICNEEEILILIKSRRDLLPEIINLVRELHSYEVPEVIALPIVGGSEDYLEWLDEALF